MKTSLRQVVGIDVAKDELVVCLGTMSADLNPELYANRKFANTQKGFEALTAWVAKLTDPSADLRYVMEATGVYHESLAYYLDQRGCQISIVLPNKISNYARTLDVKTTTDKTAAEAIARFGLERKLSSWKRPKKVYKSLKQLNREREQIVVERTMVKNHLHAELSEAEPSKASVERIKRRIAFLKKQELQVKQEIAGVVKEDQQVKAEVKLLCSIPGVGALTASIVLGETNGFELIRSKKQLTSYAGLDVMEKQSGTSVKGKPKISKKGNRFLRKAMHMPALAAIRHDEKLKGTYVRLLTRHGIKMKSVVAVQRKILEMTFTIFKSQKPYDKNYVSKQNLKEVSIPINN